MFTIRSKPGAEALSLRDATAGAIWRNAPGALPWPPEEVSP